MNKFTATYWNTRYQEQQTGWDLGGISPPLKKIIDQLEDTSQKILLPGAGNAYEAEYLYQNNFNNVYVLDISEKALHSFENRCPRFPKAQLLHQDFFSLQMKFDLVLEQTFFCTLSPHLRNEYALKMAEILAEKKLLTGVLFDFPLTEKGPPFGGSKLEYINYFSSYFEIEAMGRATHSHPKRQGKELFIKLKRK